jgi:hypothetical protein
MTMKKTHAFLITLIAILIATSSIAAVAQTTQAINLAEIRVVNALVGIGSVDVYIDGNRVALGLEPETASIYFTVPAGRHIVAVRGPGADGLSMPIADTLVDLAPDNSQTAVVYQKNCATEEYTPLLAQSGAMMVLNDDRTPVLLGKTRLTAVHVAVGTPNRLSIAYPSRASLLHEIGPEQSYGTIDVDAGEYSLALVNADTPGLDILERTQQSFYGNTLYTLVIVPDIRVSAETGVPACAAQPRMFAVSAPVDPPQGGIRMRIIHAAHNTQVLDIYVDGRLVAQRVNYSRFTEYLGMADYSHRIALRPYLAAPDSEPLAQAEFTITPQNRSQRNWTLMLLNASSENSAALQLLGSNEEEDETNTMINTPGGAMIMVLVPDNISQTRINFARVRLLHTVDGAAELSMLAPAFPPEPLPLNVTPTEEPEVTPTPLPPVMLVEPVIFGSEANEQEIPAGLYTELNIVAGGSLELATLPAEELVGGLVYTYVVIGSPLGDPPLQILQFADYGRGLPPTRLYLGIIAISNGPGANVRRQPNTNSGVLTQLPNGTEVEVLGRNVTGEWISIRFPQPETDVLGEGWVSGSLVRVTRLGVPINVLTLPVVSEVQQ